ncbi:MAG: competence/damage-inducible protein A [Deltaproteobacteria bacterium]|nr:competence/damage-inducible protein A [Deltaproteobacteria bacterium]
MSKTGISMGLNLLEKTELWVNNVSLSGVNLTDLAAAVADVLKLERQKVLVVDVGKNALTLDILEKDIPAKNILGKEAELLAALSKIEGVRLAEDAYIHSNGILGLICLTDQDPEEFTGKVEAMVGDIKSRIAKRAIVFPTGFELIGNNIKDTNTSFLRDLLIAEGFKVEAGPIIDDDPEDMVAKLSEALSKAYGLIVTTGGVGAEEKDHSVESVLALDPQAATPYLVKFEKGTGRHVKDGVRIAVGRVGPSLLVALPGPNDEVRIAAAELLDCLRLALDKTEIAERLATVLRAKLMEKKERFHHGHHRSDH